MLFFKNLPTGEGMFMMLYQCGFLHDSFVISIFWADSFIWVLTWQIECKFSLLFVMEQILDLFILCLATRMFQSTEHDNQPSFFPTLPTSPQVYSQNQWIWITHPCLLCSNNYNLNKFPFLTCLPPFLKYGKKKLMFYIFCSYYIPCSCLFLQYWSML